MPASPRRIVRSAVGLAAVAPAVGLIILAVALMLDGGFGGFLAGLVVAGIAVALLVAGLVMTYAPVSIARLLGGPPESAGSDEAGGSDGHGSGGARVLEDDDASG